MWDVHPQTLRRIEEAVLPVLRQDRHRAEPPGDPRMRRAPRTAVPRDQMYVRQMAGAAVWQVGALLPLHQLRQCELEQGHGTGGAPESEGELDGACTYHQSTYAARGARGAER